MKSKIDYNALIPDRSGAEPLHVQLRDALRRELRNLSPDAGTILLSERELTALLGLNRGTIHRAYAELMAEGLVRKRPDKSLEVLPSARSKIVGGFRVIGIVLPMDFPSYVDNNHQNAIPYLKGIIGQASRKNLSCLMLTPPEASATDRELDAFIEEYFPRLCGLIHLGALHTPAGFPPGRILRRIMEYRELPQVCVSGHADYSHIGSVQTDARAGALAAANYLRSAGITSVGMVHCGIRWSDSPFRYTAEGRDRILLECMRSAGLTCSAVASGKNGREILSLLASPERPQALFCHNDRIAASVLEQARKIGLHVPEDLRIIGFDGSPVDPALATIDSRAQLVAERAIDWLVESFEKGVNSQNMHRSVLSVFCPGEVWKKLDKKKGK